MAYFTRKTHNKPPFDYGVYKRDLGLKQRYVTAFISESEAQAAATLFNKEFAEIEAQRLADGRKIAELENQIARLTEAVEPLLRYQGTVGYLAMIANNVKRAVGEGEQS